MPNFIKIGQTVAEIWRFNGFQNGGRPPSWICEIQIFLTVGAFKRPILHQRTKFRKNQSNRGGYIAIFVIFNMAAAAILNFQKLEILTTFFRCRGPICVIVPNVIKIGQTVAEIWRFNGFQNGGRPLSWICEIIIFNGWSG